MNKLNELTSQQTTTTTTTTITLRRALLLAALLLGTIGAQAQTDYVFYNGIYGYLYNDNGTLKSSTSLQFDKSSMWTASDDLGTTGRTISSYTNSSLYLRTSTNNGGTVSLNASGSNWQMRDNALCVRTSGGWGGTSTNYYLKASSATAFTTASGNNGNQYTPYAVTITDIAAGLSGFTVSGTSSINATGTYSDYTHTNATYYASAYTDYYFSNTHHYVNTSNASTTANPATTISSASYYSWSLSDNAEGYATVNASTGAVTVTAIPTSGNYTITLTCTLTYNEQTVTASFPITLTLTGVSGGTVTIDDREDHSWSYYQASGDLPTGYPTTYLSSPDPRNVKITYRGGSVSGASAVAISALDGEGQNEMVYYKTMEKSVPGMTGDYPYTVISNPFSKRPATGSGNSKVYYGFAGWKVISGGEYISEYADNAVLPLDATIHFTNLNTNYTANCTSAEVVFEATWTTATVKTGSSAQSFTGGTYETNFWVLSGNSNIGNITVPANATVSARYPDGTVSFTSNLTGTITAGGNNAKVEFVNMASTGNVTAANYTFTMGRGIVNSSNGGQLSGCNTNANCNQTVKIESGTYNTFYNFTSQLNAARTCDQLVILGCDYDRAKNDNTKLTIRGDMYIGTGIQLNRSANSLYTRTYIKSGNFGSTVTVAGNSSYTGAGGSNTYYYSVSNTHNAGRRYLCVEGGRLMGIAGGMDETNNQTVTARAFDLRVRGTAQIDGVVYGAAEFANARGIRTMICTGGTINGWVAAGANGTQTTNGALTGATYVYVGGKTKVDSEGSTQVLNRAIGGNVFGAGCGYAANSSSGQVLNYNTNIAVADDAYVERGVYGGGSYGYTTNTANIYILGGTIDGKDGGVNGTTYLGSIDGGVYGGACQNQGGTVNITMTDGTVNGSIYGGSNYTGTLSGTSTVTLNGGTVNGSIYGGGNGEGSATNVNGAVQVTVNGGVVTGAVYGCGNVSGSPQSTVRVTINGSDPTTVDGSGNKVYAIQGVYGGGNQAAYDPATAANGCPQVVVNGCATSIADVFGGGNAAPVPQTDVKIYGGDIGRVFAGGNGVSGTPANVGYNNKLEPTTANSYGSGTAAATIYGGTIGQVFGGSNAHGVIRAGTTVTINSDGTCPMQVGEVFGGGNLADSKPATVNVVCTGEGLIDYVYGGANQADVDGDIELNITGGRIEHVFGGNNLTGTVSGTITVNVDWVEGSCSSNYLGYVYGGGNQATYTYSSDPVYPQVNIKNGTVTHDVFGGGYGDPNDDTKGVVTGTPKVVIGVETASKQAIVLGRVFGGGNAAKISGSTDVRVLYDSLVKGSIFGGGNAAAVTADTFVLLNHEARCYGNVYGGGNQGAVGGDTKVIINSSK